MTPQGSAASPTHSTEARATFCPTRHAGAFCVVTRDPNAGLQVPLKKNHVAGRWHSVALQKSSDHPARRQIVGRLSFCRPEYHLVCFFVAPPAINYRIEREAREKHGREREKRRKKSEASCVSRKVNSRLPTNC